MVICAQRARFKPGLLSPRGSLQGRALVRLHAAARGADCTWPQGAWCAHKPARDRACGTLSPFSTLKGWPSFLGQPRSSICTSRLIMSSRPMVSTIMAHSLRVRRMASCRFCSERLWKSSVPHCRPRSVSRRVGVGWVVFQACVHLPAACRPSRWAHCEVDAAAGRARLEQLCQLVHLLAGGANGDGDCAHRPARPAGCTPGRSTLAEQECTLGGSEGRVPRICGDRDGAQVGVVKEMGLGLLYALGPHPGLPAPCTPRDAALWEYTDLGAGAAAIQGPRGPSGAKGSWALSAPTLGCPVAWHPWQAHERLRQVVWSGAPRRGSQRRWLKHPQRALLPVAARGERWACTPSLRPGSPRMQPW